MGKKRVKGYVQFNDSKNVLQIFAMEDPELGYEIAMEIEYGSNRDHVENILNSCTVLVDMENLSEIVASDRFLVKFK